MHPFEDLIVPENAVGIHWFGQSTFGLKDPAGSIAQVDPYYPKERPLKTFIHPLPPLSEEALRTDCILLTHDHADHICLESIDRIHTAYPEAHYICPMDSTQKLRGVGIPAEHIAFATAGDEILVGNMKVHPVWSRPPDGISQDGIPAPDVQHLGYVVDTGTVRVYISGDLLGTFGEYAFLLQPIRDLKPDVGLLSIQPTRGALPSFEDSAKIAVKLGLKTVVPAHYGCFVGGNYDLQEWASHLSAGGPRPLVIPYNQSVVYSPESDA